jgi:hypothetical protein
MATDKPKVKAPEEKKIEEKEAEKGSLKVPKSSDLKPGETWYGGNKKVEGPPKEKDK